MRAVAIGIVAVGLIGSGVGAAIARQRHDDARAPRSVTPEPAPRVVGSVERTGSERLDVVLGTRMGAHSSLHDAKRAAKELGEAPTRAARDFGGYGMPIAVVRDAAHDRFVLHALDVIDGDTRTPLRESDPSRDVEPLRITDRDVVAYMDGFVYDTTELRGRRS